MIGRKFLLSDPKVNMSSGHPVKSFEDCKTDPQVRNVVSPCMS